MFCETPCRAQHAAEAENPDFGLTLETSILQKNMEL